MTRLPDSALRLARRDRVAHTTTAGGGVDQDALSGLDLCGVDERPPRGERGRRQRGGPVVADRQDRQDRPPVTTVRSAENVPQLPSGSLARSFTR